MSLPGFIYLNRNLLSFGCGVLLIFGIISGIGAQSVDIREITVRKNRPDEIFHKAATVVSLWISDEVGSFETIIMKDSEIEIFEDNKGFNLIAAHDQAIKAWDKRVKQLAKQNRYVSMGRSRELLSAEGLDEDDGVSGFYLTIESWALPSAGSTTLHVAGTVNYIVALDEQAVEVFSDLIPKEMEIIYIDEYEIEFSDISTSDGIVSFTFYSELPVTDAAFYNSNGKQIADILYTMNGNLVMEMEEEYFNSAIRLVVSYRKTSKLSVRFDEIAGFGL